MVSVVAFDVGGGKRDKGQEQEQEEGLFKANAVNGGGRRTRWPVLPSGPMRVPSTAGPAGPGRALMAGHDVLERGGERVCV